MVGRKLCVCVWWRNNFFSGHNGLEVLVNLRSSGNLGEMWEMEKSIWVERSESSPSVNTWEGTFSWSATRPGVSDELRGGAVGSRHLITQAHCLHLGKKPACREQSWLFQVCHGTWSSLRIQVEDLLEEEQRNYFLESRLWSSLGSRFFSQHYNNIRMLKGMMLYEDPLYYFAPDFPGPHSAVRWPQVCADPPGTPVHGGHRAGRICIFSSHQHSEWLKAFSFGLLL